MDSQGEIYFHQVVFSAHEKGLPVLATRLACVGSLSPYEKGPARRDWVRVFTRIRTRKRTQADARLCLGASLHHQRRDRPDRWRFWVGSGKAQARCRSWSRVCRSASAAGTDRISNWGHCRVHSSLPASTQAAAGLLLSSLQPGPRLPSTTKVSGGADAT